MSWAQLATDSAFLILSILSGTGAAVVLLHGIAHSRPHNVSHSDPTLPSRLFNEPGSQRRRPSLLDRITLLNRNLIQCPRCLMIDSAHARFCIRCGTSMQSYGELPTDNMHSVEAQYLAQDESSRIFGLSMRIDPKTRIGVIIGIQNRAPPEQINEAKD